METFSASAPFCPGMQPMDLHPATLDGLSGEGYVLVRRHGRGRVSCGGVFSTADPNARKQLRNPTEVWFEGVVYSGVVQQRAAMRVLIHSTQTRLGHTTSLFVSVGDPLAPEDPPTDQ